MKESSEIIQSSSEKWNVSGVQQRRDTNWTPHGCSRVAEWYKYSAELLMVTYMCVRVCCVFEFVHMCDARSYTRAHYSWDMMCACLLRNVSNTRKNSLPFQNKKIRTKSSVIMVVFTQQHKMLKIEFNKINVIALRCFLVLSLLRSIETVTVMNLWIINMH